jgi:hypothetical protein
MTLTIPRPAAAEYASYFGHYIAQVDTDDVLAVLRKQPAELSALLSGLSAAQAGHRYEPGKWSIREVIGHLCEAERVFAYRALAFAHNDATPLPGWDENAYIAAGRYDQRTLASLLADFAAARASTVSLFDGFDADELARPGVANGRNYTVRALAYITAGHAAHHIGILRERYISGM